MLSMYLHTTEDGEWISLRGRVRGRGLYKHEARRLAVRWRKRGHLARVRRDTRRGGWMVLTHEPRRNAPRRCDLRY